MKMLFIIILLAGLVGFIYGRCVRIRAEKARIVEEQRKSDQLEQIREKAEKERKEREEALARRRKEAGDRFNSIMSSIPSHDVQVDSGASRKPVSECNKKDRTVSNITKKTNINGLGDFVAVDVETTGLHCQHDQIVELSAVRFRSWEPVEKFSTLVNPGSSIPEDSVSIHGITDDMVKDAPKIGEVIKDFDRFVGADNMVGHNLLFDLGFLDYAGSEYAETKRKYYDTLELARYLDLAVRDNKLTTLCEHYDIRDNSTAHRSDSDALATGILFKKLAELKVM